MLAFMGSGLSRSLSSGRTRWLAPECETKRLGDYSAELLRLFLPEAGFLAAAFLAGVAFFDPLARSRTLSLFMCRPPVILSRSNKAGGLTVR